LNASDRLKAPELLCKIRQPNSAMQNPARSIIIGIGPTNNTDNRQILTISTSNRISVFSVVAGAFQITFHIKINANDVFSFFKNHF